MLQQGANNWHQLTFSRQNSLWVTAQDYTLRQCLSIALRTNHSSIGRKEVSGLGVCEFSIHAAPTAGVARPEKKWEALDTKNITGGRINGAGWIFRKGVPPERAFGALQRGLFFQGEWEPASSNAQTKPWHRPFQVTHQTRRKRPLTRCICCGKERRTSRRKRIWTCSCRLFGNAFPSYGRGDCSMII